MSNETNIPSPVDIVAVTLVGPGGTDYERTYTYHGNYSELKEWFQNNVNKTIVLERFGAPYIRFSCPLHLVQQIEPVGKLSPIPGESYFEENKIPVNRRKVYKFE